MAAQSSIEQFVKTYLSKYRNSGEARRERIFVEKAIKQIHFFLDPLCCEDPDASIAFSRRDSVLNLYIGSAFNNKLDRRRFKKSLERTIVRLTSFLNDSCCFGD